MPTLIIWEKLMKRSNSRIAFIHTRGLPSIFAYQTDIIAGLDNE